ncbi:FGGY-family carbohydrate kinase [Sinorhizobium meliloti WSM1022]|jgi:sugar (pentulose or hexulose) kinase|uniref:FGGY-family carbohydrate kinase n=2 Tax=Rhizobium meliloti TaxID=382 RepID=UPI0003F51994|nr:FGGY-family carbohydrate kinase [Sinorhizobium meliloti]ASQ03428.1 carbohydrate kinase [Sinorhizobium meliloti]MCO6425777.1 FGGY-family carbohydrate kinase [Sinorhizobium meliloti]MDW9408374.1 carbohydrate kinase [Sinorhizobium meliloti]MDW9442594.1 carbohydrate kinase [Sinorhizobium meliloti]MDW9453263.1 carbohydrate kinase [Sinorhizobium meliloti]
MSGQGKLVLGIDLGTSGARAVAMTAAGEIVASGAARLTAFSDDHRDPLGWWKAVQAALAQALEAIDGSHICAVGIDGTSGTMLPVAADGAPLATPLMYNDPVGDTAILERIAVHAPKESAAHGATSGLAKLLTFQSLPEVFRVIHQADWIAGHFTGLYDVSDENNALKTGYDPVARNWPEWLARTGARIDLLPDVLPAGAPVATISPAAAEAFGLPSETVIVAGTTDGCASFLATGADRPGDAVSALGTTLTVKMLSDKPLFAPEFGLYSHRIGDMWLAGGASNTGGAVLAAHFSNDRIAELSEQIDPASDTGLDFYPLLKPGERFPVADPAFMPRMEPRPTEDAEFLKAIFEGIAGVERLAYERLVSLGSPALGSIRTVGGGAKNGVWTEIRKRRLVVPFLPVLSEEAAAGAARLALSGAKEAGVL